MSNIFGTDKSRRMKHRSALPVGNREGKNPFGKHGLREQYNIKMDFEEVGLWIAYFIRLAQVRNHW